MVSSSCPTRWMSATGSPHSDWGRFLARVRHAEVAPSNEAAVVLREALELVAGPPFMASSGYSWAYSEGIATEMVEVVKHAAHELAQHCLDSGDPAGALWAARRGQLLTSPADSQRLTLIVMEAHAELGSPAAAFTAYRELVADLEDLDPDIDPDQEVTEAMHAISRRSKAS
jgi:hypothetical protein